MAGRIMTLQRQARELGRLRTGLTDRSGSKPRPVRSETWIVTSHAEHYIEAAAAEWGGAPEKWDPQGSGTAQFRVITETDCLDAILPPGDPLSQSYEMWSRGGCQRRCDGITEQISDSPCVCIAEHGDNWYERPKGSVCSAHTRLNVILPQMPDIGVWRMETGSYYAANEIAAHVDLIRNATRGEIAVPIRLRMEQRQRIANGQTKKFPVVAVELRGATAGQIMSGTANLDALAELPSQTARAIEAAPPVRSEGDWLALVADATTEPELLELFKQAKEQGASAEVAKAIKAKLPAAVGQAPAVDVDTLWQQIVAVCPVGWSLDDLEIKFSESNDGTMPGAAEPAQLQKFLDELRGVPA